MVYTIGIGTANAMADAAGARCNSGTLNIYAGTRPALPGDTLGAAVLLASLPLSATAFGAAVNGTATANAITSDSSADATGTASFFRVYMTGGTTGVLDGSVTATGGGGDMTLNNVAIQAGVIVSITSWTITSPQS